jgi:hypothetical protein
MADLKQQVADAIQRGLDSATKNGYGNEWGKEEDLRLVLEEVMKVIPPTLWDHATAYNEGMGRGYDIALEGKS